MTFSENLEQQNPQLNTALRLRDALLIEYGYDDDTAELKFQNLALDMVDIVSNNLQLDDATLLEQIKNCDGYLKLRQKVEFNDEDISDKIRTIKQNLSKKE